MTKEELLGKFTNDKLLLEYSLKNNERLKSKYKLVRKVIDCALVLEGIVPFIFSGLFSFYAFNSFGVTPFIIDKVEHSAFSKVNRFSKIVYSGRWEEVDGEYKRVETIYELSHDLLKKDVTSMTKDELEKYFTKVDEKIIIKSSLSYEDYSDEDEAIVIFYEDESLITNFLSTDLFLIIFYVLGVSAKKVKKVIFQDYVNNSLINLKYQYRVLDEDEIRNILSIKEENLSLLGLYGKHR